MVKLITPDEAERVRAAIQAAERMTTGEIRVSIAPRSVRLNPVVWTGAALLIGLAVYAERMWSEWGFLSMRDLAISAAAGICGGGFVAWIISRIGIAGAVRRRAERDFTRLGIAKTSGHTGALILLSVAERRAVLVADQAIHEKVGQGAWDAVVADLISAIHSGKAADGLVQTVGAVGRALAEHFPRKADDVNELPDEVDGA